MKRIINAAELVYPMIEDIKTLINLRFNNLQSNNKCQSIDYYPMEKDDKSICIHLSYEPNQEDLEFIRLQFATDDPDKSIEEVDLGNNTWRVWITNIIL
jgi:hypothetical protein